MDNNLKKLYGYSVTQRIKQVKLIAKLVDNKNEIVITEVIIRDEDNILNAFTNKEALINYIFDNYD